jgi:asparagine synthase (glutamine-hydrolysing)
VLFRSTNDFDSEFLNFALEDLSRRGPDQKLIWKSDDKLKQFGFARLAIRDLTSSGSQPMLSNDSRWVLMYNGETYNTDELLDFSNIDKGALNGTSDTEIILKSFEIKGVHETISKMDGIFAISVLDQKENKLYLIRDHLGIKPLYFGIDDKGLVFSSNYHHVVKHPYCNGNKINSDALLGYFQYGFVQSGEGLFENTYLVPPSHITEIDLNSFSFKFLKFDFSGINDINDLEEVIEHVVSKQLVSDVPIGTFLSGGIDSAIVTSFAAKKDKDIVSFTIGVNDPNLDETKLSKLTAESLSVNQQIHQFTEIDIISAIHQFDDSLAEPLADFSSLLTLKICELAKQKLTVVLSGDGGDELFWGYPRMATFWKYYPFLKSPRFIRFFSIALAKVKGKIIPFRLLKFKNPFDYYLSAQGLTGNKEWMPLLFKNSKRKKVSFAVNQLYVHYSKNIDKFIKETELAIHLQRVLLKVDRASMYHSVEVRTPLLSPLIIATSNRYKYFNCIKDGLGKLPLREVLNNIMNVDEVIKSKKKGFEPPMAMWMRGELKYHIENIVLNIPQKLTPYISKRGIKNLWKEHLDGKDNSVPIWAIYSLFVWIIKTDLFLNEN